ncbi:unnamed protein product [Penicillium palitans]
MAVVWTLDTWHYVMAQGGFRPRAFSTAFSTACLVYPTTIKRLRFLPSPSPLSSLLLSLPVPLLIFVFHLAHTSLSQEHLPSIFSLSMFGSQEDTGLEMDASSIPGSASTSPTIKRSESVAPDIQLHRPAAAPTIRSATVHIDQLPYQAGSGNPSPLTPRPESMVHTHASINPHPMAGNLAPTGLTMTEGHRPQQYAHYQGQHGAMAGHQNQLSAALPMNTQAQRSHSQHPASQPLIPGSALIQRSAPANNSFTSSLQSYPQRQAVWVRHPSQPHAQRQQWHSQRRHDQRHHGQRRHGQQWHGQQRYGQQRDRQQWHGHRRRGQQWHDQQRHGQQRHGQRQHGQQRHGQTLIQDSARANNTLTASDVPPSPSVPAGGVPRRRFAVTPPWRRAP